MYFRIDQMKLQKDAVLTAKQHGTEGLKKLLRGKIAKSFRIPEQEIRNLIIRRESVDARKKPEICFIYSVEFETDTKKVPRNSGGMQLSMTEPTEYHFPKSGEGYLKHPIVIVGMGPAGLFCGYFLAKQGYRPLILERGKCVEERQADVERFWETGVLDTGSNVQFGEGGAGTFSDGKLNTLVKDKYGRNQAVLQAFVECGAGEEILYEAKPHIGTDVLCKVVKNMREEILQRGGEVRFQSQVTELQVQDGKVCSVIVNGQEKLPCEQVVLAVGHSARDTFQMLYEKQIPMEAKAFAVGLRVEHLQSMINVDQYGEEISGLGAATYKVTAQADNGRGVYSFCMCPGGYVVNASSEAERVAVNGMSYSGRNGRNANSAIIVSVTPEDFGSDHPLAGVEFQRGLERKAYELAGGRIPMQRYGVFRACVEQKLTQTELCQCSGKTVDIDTGMFSEDNTECSVFPEHKGQSAWGDVSRILPAECNEAFVQGMEQFGRKIKGFDRGDTILSGVESRTSSPLRITRDETLQSAVRGLYPCGEGAGYAGGITSAAMDGLRVAEQIAANYAKPE